MPTPLRELLEKYRNTARSEREKGTYFEKLAKVWLETAPAQREQFSRVLTWAEFAREYDHDARDTGIDLVAQLAGSPDDWCAVQCKFYAAGYRIQKADIDSFFTASGRRPFTRRMIVDSTAAEWSEHAEAALIGQNVETTRVSLDDLEQSGVDWARLAAEGEAHLLPRKEPRPHQVEAIGDVLEGFKQADRGKLIMACGTGKTFVALKIAEEVAGKGKRVLLLVPSLFLMSQTIKAWSVDSALRLRSFAVCSDQGVGIRRARADDLADTDVHDLEIPATTRGVTLAAQAKADDPERMTVVFSTYQSLQAINDAQANYGLPEFDLIVCDEAHRTTGATLAGDDESAFVRVHDAAYVRGRKRLYMTATPRIFSDTVRQTARDVDAVLCSMDDPALYGETLHTLNFSTAVRKGLLSDYKVIVLAVDEASVSASIQKRLSDENSELVLDDATKIVGCYKALTKFDLRPDVAGDTGPMRRAVAFARDIKRSKLVASEFARVARDWRAALPEEVAEAMPGLDCELRHVDGTFSDGRRKESIAWLEASTGEDGPCRILTNARCLSEGVDVPALDAILFLHPRKSQIDVVQAVGRVMRRAPGKNMGYVILPVGVPAGVEPEKALDDNEKYRVVWQILNALRAHDDRLDATINKIDLGVDPGDRIEVVAVSNALPLKTQGAETGLGLGDGQAVDEETVSAPRPPGGGQIDFGFDEFAKAILARIVKKCGTRTYWEDWAGDVARIAEVHIARIKAAVEAAGTEEARAFQAFLKEIKDDLNDSVTADEAIEMLAQHMITRPVFDALFEGYGFTERNPVSKALQAVLDVLDRQNLQKETEKLERFYASVRLRAAGIDDAVSKQKIVVELYDKFFRTAFPRLTERLGIVYTPVEVVDFIVRSVDEVLRSEFSQTLGSEGVHIIDPFVGTGTFIVRLLQSGLIDPAHLARKYREEIHANEIVLLAYYIAAINIEAAYHDIAGGDYEAFPGICLTDTFQMYEKEDLVSGMLVDNSSRRARQKKLPIKVIFANPPYSGGQRSENDNAANVAYSHLDQRIRETYAARSDARLQKGLYDSYIRAIRWGSDRLRETGGVMAYATNANWLDSNSMDGLRKCLAEEFSSLYVFHLRGNQRHSQGEASRREGGKIFGQGSRQPVAISVLVSNPSSPTRGAIHFHDIGDYLSREEKLAKVDQFGSIGGIARGDGWRSIAPDEHGDWLNQRDSGFDRFFASGDKEKKDSCILFSDYSSGVKTNRDAWCINSSRSQMLGNMSAMVNVYNAEVSRFGKAAPKFDNPKSREEFVDKFVTDDDTKISWTRELKAMLGRQREIVFNSERAALTIYRPFTRQWLYFDRQLNNTVYQIPRIFPAAGYENRVIAVSGSGARSGFSALMMDAIPNFDCIEKGQGFPRWLYEPSVSETEGGLFGEKANKANGSTFTRRDAITDEGLEYFQAGYPGETITKDDLFYFVYGLLHSEGYRTRYADNLSKQLPRLPLLKRVEDFRAFVAAGRLLGDLHVGYETVEPYPVTVEEGDLRLATIADPVAYYRVEKMKYAGKRGAIDKTTVIYNPRITMTNIPLEAYGYVVNGKPALEWIMERQAVRTEVASGIVNDANRYAVETAGDPAYPFKLFCRVITVSLETQRIIKRLPALDIRNTA